MSSTITKKLLDNVRHVSPSRVKNTQEVKQATKKLQVVLDKNAAPKKSSKKRSSKKSSKKRSSKKRTRSKSQKKPWSTYRSISPRKFSQCKKGKLVEALKELRKYDALPREKVCRSIQYQRRKFGGSNKR